MTIGVMVKGALKSGAIAMVPLETMWVQPNISSIRESCDKELKVLYPLDFSISSYEIIGIKMIISRIYESQHPKDF